VIAPVSIEGGIGHPPSAPGIGVEVNEAEAARHPFQPEVTMARFHRDGSVADW
jgi:galactonate dehydratase